MSRRPFNHKILSRLSTTSWLQKTPTTTLFAGKAQVSLTYLPTRSQIFSGGTCGPVIAGRLSENPNYKILVLEAGKDSKDMDNMHMAGA